jgi:hypothetical protein
VGADVAEHGDEGDLVGVDAEGYGGGDGEVAQGVVDAEQGPNLLPGEVRGLST